jgi:hypothetical protein
MKNHDAYLKTSETPVKVGNKQATPKKPKENKEIKGDKDAYFTKVSMNLNQRSIENVNRLCELLGETNKTRVVSTSLELARVILEIKNRGDQFLIRSGKVEKEMVIL